MHRAQNNTLIASQCKPAEERNQIRCILKSQTGCWETKHFFEDISEALQRS